MQYRWSNYVGYIDGWIPKASLLVPILGYIILFNDTTTDLIEFKNIADETESNMYITGKNRLKMIYFALVFLGISNFWYRVRRPYQFRFGTNVTQYTRTALEVFKLSDFNDINNYLLKNDHNISKEDYSIGDWDCFIKTANNGADNKGYNNDWEKAKSMYGNLLRGMLDNAYYRADITRQIDLSCCLVLSTLGYILLIIPSCDLFIKILLTLFKN